MLDLLQTGWLCMLAHVRAGGVVMMPLLLVSLLMWVLIVERLLFFRRLRRRDGEKPRRGELRRNIEQLRNGELRRNGEPRRKGEPRDARDLPRPQPENAYGLADAGGQPGIVQWLASDFLRERSGRCELDAFIMDETVLRITNRLRDRLALIGVLCAVAPLLGLLGTVTGMIATFDVLAVFGTGNAKAMAGGISEALITTETGLLVAIPGLYMKTFLERRAEGLAHMLSRAGFHFKQQLQSL